MAENLIQTQFLYFFILRTYAEPPYLGALSLSWSAFPCVLRRRGVGPLASYADAGSDRYLVGVIRESPLQMVYDLVCMVLVLILILPDLISGGKRINFVNLRLGNFTVPNLKLTRLKCCNSRGGFRVKLMSFNKKPDEPAPNDIMHSLVVLHSNGEDIYFFNFFSH